MRRTLCAALFCAFGFVAPPTALAVTIDTVLVANPGNADSIWGYGGVDYNYRMGTFEVTNSQYAEFLNAKAKGNALGLYNSDMGLVSGPTILRGGITQSGPDGNYVYGIRPNMGNKPVASVSLYDVLRFANWMHNGQGTGDTESGAYTLEGGTPLPSNAATIARNPGAIWFLPTEDEWIKAAYHDPRTEAEGGPQAGYNHFWKYATQSFDDPTVATANAIGDISNPGANVVNYSFGTDWEGQDGHFTTVGSAGPLSASYYGTYDQAGNVGEWTLLEAAQPNAQGGNWRFEGPFLVSHIAPIGPLSGLVGTDEFGFIGFRLATVPEPSAMLLAAMGLAGMLLAGRRKRIA